MKLLLIEHTSWIEMMAHAWEVCGAEIARVRVPVAAMLSDPAARFEAAETIRQAIRAAAPDLVLDVNAVGVLPLDAAGTHWTTEETDAPWCLWWWDAPHVCAFPLRRKEEAAGLWKALRAPAVRHFFWDAVLAREYTEWMGQPCRYLPTAAHTGLFHPDAIAISDRKFEPVELTFLGSAFPLPRKSSLPKVYEVARACMENRDSTVLELARRRAGTMDAFGRALAKSGSSVEGPFHPELLEWKSVLDAYIGYERRTVYLHRALEEVRRGFFAGKGWPEVFGAETPFFQPAHLVMRYQTSLFNADFGNGHSFSGTSLRCYEIMAAGGALLCARFPDFDPEGALENKVYLAYATPDEMAGKIRAFRAEPRLLEPLREQARAFVAERHGWEHRLAELARALSAPEENNREAVRIS